MEARRAVDFAYAPEGLRMRQSIGFTIVAIAVLAALLLASCEEEPTPTAAPMATSAPTPVATALPTPTATSAPTPTPLPPLPTLMPTPTPYVHEEPADPCGPHWRGYGGPMHEGFLHWAGGGSHLVFDQADTLWTLEIKDGSMREIVDADATHEARTPTDTDSLANFLYGFYADVSPDGSQIVYSTCEFLLNKGLSNQHSEGYELVTINVDGTEKTRLTDNHHLDHYPVWSPDGRHIVFVKYERFERLGLSFYPDYPDDRIGVRLATRSNEGPGIPWLPTRNVALYPPAWSPDGQTMAYMVNEGDVDDHELVVWTIGLGDAEPVRIGSAVSAPTWSPDGEELAFVSVKGSEVFVYAAKPDGTEIRGVWRGLGKYGLAHWSPDGREVLVVGGDWAYVASADGFEERSLTQNRPVRHVGYPIPISHGAWSPDGSMIALRDEFSISIVSRDGTEWRVLAEGDRNGWPDWLQVVQPAQPEATAVPPTETPTPAHAEPTATPTE